MTGLVSFDSPQDLTHVDASSADEDDRSIERPNLYLFYLAVLAQSMGWPLFAVGIASIAYSVWRRSAPDVMVLSYSLLNYLVFSGTSSDTLYYPRYALPIIVVMTLLSGRAISELAGRTGRPKVAMAILTLACIGWPLAHTLASTEAYSKVDTRTTAKIWVESNIPPASRILIEGLKIGPTNGTVPLGETAEALDRRIEYWTDREPKQARYLELKRDVSHGVGYELELVRLDAMESLSDYVSRGVQYFVMRPDYIKGSRRSDSGSARLLEDLRSNPRVRMVKKVQGGTQTPPGPTIEIYRWQ